MRNILALASLSFALAGPVLAQERSVQIVNQNLPSSILRCHLSTKQIFWQLPSRSWLRFGKRQSDTTFQLRFAI